MAQQEIETRFIVSFIIRRFIDSLTIHFVPVGGIATPPARNLHW